MTTADPLQHALHDESELELRPLPRTVADLLLSLDAPPRLAAHLRLVHDVAHELVEWLARRHPTLAFDREAVLFGAATHDIGKLAHPAELSGPGSRHEEAGRELLLAHGFDARLARFAGTHAAWAGPDIRFEDLLVSVADKVWKNKRVPELEDRVVASLAAAGGGTVWEEFLALDDLLGSLGDGADRRLAFQAGCPVHRSR